jgi:hypothetical protein
MVIISSARRMFCLLEDIGLVWHHGRITNLVSNLGLGLAFYNQAIMLYALMHEKIHVWVVWEGWQRKCVRERMHQTSFLKNKL